MTESQPKPNILIVDDEPANIDMLGEVLMPENKIRVVVNGPEAIEIAVSSNPPDLILLDIMMPGMDGYEVCRQLKADQRSTRIPIIFITARSEEEDEQRGFQLGAVDYITKPFRLSIVQARVRTHLELKRYQDQMESIVREQTRDIRATNMQLRSEIQAKNKIHQALEKTNQSLEESLTRLQKTQDHLIQSEKMAALGGLVAGVAHEINTPVGIGVTASSFLSVETRKAAQRLSENALTGEDFQKYLSVASEATAIIETNLKRAGELIQSFKQVGVDQSSKDRRFFRCKEYIDMILLSLRPKLKNGRHQVNVECPDLLEIDSYPGAFSQIITNLVMNSLTHGFNGESRKTISIAVSQEADRIVLRYHDNGRGMHPETIEKIFEPFFTTRRNRGGTGLGLHIVYNLVTQVLQGTIQCESRVKEGTAFTITLPVCPVSDADRNPSPEGWGR